MSSNEELIGRTDINDLEAILAITNTDVDEVTHAVKDNAEALFTWDYERTRPALGKLYEKAKKAQWNAQTDLRGRRRSTRRRWRSTTPSRPAASARASTSAAPRWR